ncbi:MAG: hypothetical protein JXB50_15165 [Spirochaetes bacterium]|nr:hypothetical protein [Spirochaetota bacterium]
MKKLHIAFSICGEGHGHYGRNIETIKLLSKKLPDSIITLYLYGDTLNIFMMDKELPENIKTKQIPGLRFNYKTTGFFTSILSTISNLSNWAVVLREIKISSVYLVLSPIFKLISLIIKKPVPINKNYYNKYFDYYDFAISDLEPLLPRVSLIRGKPFLTLDNQHAMLYGVLDIKKFDFKERLEHFFVCTFLQTYHPRSDLSIITSFADIPIKPRYRKKVKFVGPLFRKKILNLKGKESYGDFILVYAHNFIRGSLFPILAGLKDHNFIVFTKFDDDLKNTIIKEKHIKYYPIDPDNFINYLLTCNAIISTAGNTSLGEAVFLKKPFFAISLEGQFEQRLNRYLLEKNHWGCGCKLSKLSKENIINFLKKIDYYKNKLKESSISDNTEKITDLILNKIKKEMKINEIF